MDVLTSITVGVFPLDGILFPEDYYFKSIVGEETLEHIIGVKPETFLGLGGLARICVIVGCPPGSSFTQRFGSPGSYLVPELPCGNNLEKLSGDGQEVSTNGILDNPLIVEVTDIDGNPAPDVVIDWSITGPDGATGQTVESVTSSTDLDGTALTTTVTLGDLPGEYEITAECPECSSGSPQVFTATAIGCGELSLNLSSSEVRPIQTGGVNTSLVEANLDLP